MHLRLIKGLSYDGVVRASAAHPDVFVDDPEKYTALLESGYFEALPDAHTVTGHLCADFLGEMDKEQLDKLADDMGVDTTGKDKAEVVAAVAEEPVEVPDISKMKLEELKEFAEDNGIDLTGCTTKASILQFLSTPSARRATTTQAERLKNERESSVAGGVDHLETGHLP